MGKMTVEDPSAILKRWRTFGRISATARIGAGLSAIAAAFTLLISTYLALEPAKAYPPMLLLGELNPIPVAILCVLMVGFLFLQRFADGRRAKLAGSYLELTGTEPEGV